MVGPGGNERQKSTFIDFSFALASYDSITLNKYCAYTPPSYATAFNQVLQSETFLVMQKCDKEVNII